MTYLLLGLNVAVFLWQLTLSPVELGRAYYTMALVPCEVTGNFFSINTLLGSLRSMFLHGGWIHLIGNMVFLLIFGPHLEEFLGRAKYLVFYLLAGFAAGMLHTVFNWNVCIPSIGASGAIFGLLGGFFLLYPGTRIRSLVLFFRVPVGMVDVQAFYMLFTFFLFDLVNGLLSLGADNAATGGVAIWAHVGGFIAGLVMAFVATLFKPPPPLDPLEHHDF
jgi:membrane associated rhomboid family serine protease